MRYRWFSSRPCKSLVWVLRTVSAPSSARSECMRDIRLPLPCSLVAQAHFAPQLSAILHQFVETGVIRDSERSRFHAALGGHTQAACFETREYCNCWARPPDRRIGSVIPIITSSCRPGFVIAAISKHTRSPGGGHLLVSLPLLLVLIFEFAVAACFVDAPAVADIAARSSPGGIPPRSCGRPGPVCSVIQSALFQPRR